MIEKNTKELKCKSISFRVTEDDAKNITEKASEARMTISNFCRLKAKGIVIKAPSPLPPVADKELIVYAKEIVKHLDTLKESGHTINEETYQSINNLVSRVSNRLNNLRVL